MKLLSEEEDVYLDEGMQAEENAYSVDYDVWIDEKTGFTKIEKYNGRLHALKWKSVIIKPKSLDGRSHKAGYLR